MYINQRENQFRSRARNRFQWELSYARGSESPMEFSSHQISPVQDITSVIASVHRDWLDSRVSSLFPPSRSTNKWRFQPSKGAEGRESERGWQFGERDETCNVLRGLWRVRGGWGEREARGEGRGGGGGGGGKRRQEREKTLRVEESRAGRASRWKQAGWINFGATVPEVDA